MVKGKIITAKDISKCGDILQLAKNLVAQIATGTAEVRDHAAAQLRSLATQNHGQHQPDILAANAVAPLVKLLSSGTAHSQESAAATLGVLSLGKVDAQSAVVAAGGIVPLVTLLKMGSPKVQEVAASALAALDADISHQHGIIKAGAIPHLIAILKGSSGAAQAFAAQAIANAAAFSCEVQRSICNAGSIQLLLSLLGAGKAQKPAASALAKLAHDNKEVQAQITEAGGIAPLLALLNGIDMDAQVSAADALSEMACDNAETQSAIAKAGAISPLLALLSSRSAAAQLKSLAALAQLMRGNRDNQDSTAKLGGVKPIVGLLESNTAEVASCAACALMEFSRANPAIQQTIVDLGGISQLRNLIKLSSDEKVKTEVAGAIWSLSEDTEIKKSFASSLSSLVALLGTGSARARTHVLGAISYLGLDNQDNQVTLTQLLIELLINGSPQAQERASKALGTLVHENPSAHEVIAKAGDPTALVTLLKSNNSEAKDYALWSFSLSIETNIQSIISMAGGVPPLIHQLSDARVLIKEQAAAALAKLAFENKETCALITECGGIKPLINLLQLKAHPKARQHGANALANLATNPDACHEIVSSSGIRPLVLALDDEAQQTKKYAARALACLSKGQQSTQITIAEAGAILPLVALLEGACGPEAQEEAAGALFALADYEGNRVAITGSGGIGWLVTLLGINNQRARQHAEGALVRLSIENDNRVLIINKLVDMLQDSGKDAQEQAAASLANLARESEENRKSIVDANGIVPLLEILDSTSNKAKENAVGAIKELCRNSKNNQTIVTRAGGIPKLVGLMSGFSGGAMNKDNSLVQLCTLAADALQEMARGNPKNQDAISEAGAIQPLVMMLTSYSSQMQASAAAALANLAQNHIENQTVIARTGAIVPLLTGMREGSEAAKDECAAAILALATDHQGNKDVIVKVGGLDQLLGLLVTGKTDKSQECVAGTLAALASKHVDNRQLIAKRLVGLVSGSSAARSSDCAERVLKACSSFVSDSATNQVAIAKIGGIPPLITWLNSTMAITQAAAAHAVLCLACDNTNTQAFLAKSDAIPALLALVTKSSAEAQEYATRALWYVASQEEIRQQIASSGGIKPFVSMLAADGEVAPELAAIMLVRLARSNPDVSIQIAEQGGILPLVKLVEMGTPGSQQLAASCLAELALVPKNRDLIANAGGIETLIKRLVSPTPGTPEAAARVLAHLAHDDGITARDEGIAARQILLSRLRPKLEPILLKQNILWDEVEPKLVAAKSLDALMDNPLDFITSLGDVEANNQLRTSEVKGSAERRSRIHVLGGIKLLISMLDARGTVPRAPRKTEELAAFDASYKGAKAKDMKSDAGAKLGMPEQAAITLADIAYKNVEMQKAIVEAGAVPALLAFIRTGSQLGQEHAARAIWHLAALFDVHSIIIEAGGIPDLVQLLKMGSPRAQEMATAGISDLALGAVQERLAAGEQEAKEKLTNTAVMDCELAGVGQLEPDDQEEETCNDRLTSIAKAGVVVPLVALLSSGTAQARENTASALWHLALDGQIRLAIAKCGGISPLVAILDDGTEQARAHAANALARLATENEDSQSQIAKNCVGLLGNKKTGTQRRAARVISDLASGNPGSPVLIVNAGAISPLVNLLSGGAADVKEEVARALSTIALNSPSTQLAIASGLVELLGTGTAESQEHVSQLLLTLAKDAENCVSIVRAGAVPRLVTQVRGAGITSAIAQERAVAVLACLIVTEDGIRSIAGSNAIRPLVSMLTIGKRGIQEAHAHAAAVLADLAKISNKISMQILIEGGIGPLVALLGKESSNAAKVAAAGALLALMSGHQVDLQKAVCDAGAIRPLVALLSEDDDIIRKRAAGAIAALCVGSAENQDTVVKSKCIAKLVSLLASSVHEEVSAEAAAALAILTLHNKKNQDKLASEGGIEALINILKSEGVGDNAKGAAASALGALASGKHYENQAAIANAGGIAPLVAVLGLSSHEAREQAATALAALALDNTKNEEAIALFLVSLLGSEDKQASTKAALAVSRFARASASNQRTIAKAGGIELLVSLLDVPGAKAAAGGRQSPVSRAALDVALVQRDMAAALWSMAYNSPENQMTIAKVGGLEPLIAMLDGHAEVQADVAGALWALSDDEHNRETIGKLHGIPPLVALLKTGSHSAQETAAGALHALAETAENRITIANGHSTIGGGIPLLVSLFDGGSVDSCEQAAGALISLCVQNVTNQIATAKEAVGMLKRGSSGAAEHVAQLLRNLASVPENRSAIAKAGAVPELVRQLECGSEKSMGMAAQALALIALDSDKSRALATQELVKLLGSDNVAVRKRASEALTSMAADDKHSTTSKAKKSGPSDSFAPLVNLLKDGLKDGRVEAQEYALRSLLAASDTASREVIVEAGCIVPLIESLRLGKLSAVAQEHAAAVLSGLAPIGENAKSIELAKGIEPLVTLLTNGNAEAKEHAANCLAQLARHAGASLDIAAAVPAFVKWLANPNLGPPEVAARALSEIALENSDTQTQIAEEGAIPPLVAMVSSVTDLERGSIGAAEVPVGNPPARVSVQLLPSCGATRASPPSVVSNTALTTALMKSNVAAGALATLAKHNLINQAMIAEEEGIPPLVALLSLKTAVHRHDTYEQPCKALWHLAATEENQTAIAKAGGIAPLVALLVSEHSTTQQFAAAALQSLARDHIENQIAISKAGAIAPLVDILGSENEGTQAHAVGALLSLASHDISSRNAVVKRLVPVLDLRSATAQMNAAEALALLAARSDENRKAITDADAVEPLVRLLGDGRRVRAGTPQERAAAVLADLARSSDNKSSIVKVGGVGPLIAMLSSDSIATQTYASGALLQLSALGTNRSTIAEAGAIPPLVELLSSHSPDTQKSAAGALWNLASSAESKIQMRDAGAIPRLVHVLRCKSADTREHAVAVLSALARSQGQNKKLIYDAAALEPLIALLDDQRSMTQRHAACCLWALSDGKDGVYDKAIAEGGAIPKLANMLNKDDLETRGFAAAALLCICRDETAHAAIMNSDGVHALVALAYGLTAGTWLHTQVIEMLTLLSVPIPDPDSLWHSRLPTLLPGCAASATVAATADAGEKRELGAAAGGGLPTAAEAASQPASEPPARLLAPISPPKKLSHAKTFEVTPALDLSSKMKIDLSSKIDPGSAAPPKPSDSSLQGSRRSRRDNTSQLPQPSKRSSQSSSRTTKPPAQNSNRKDTKRSSSASPPLRGTSGGAAIATFREDGASTQTASPTGTSVVIAQRLTMAPSVTPERDLALGDLTSGVAGARKQLPAQQEGDIVDPMVARDAAAASGAPGSAISVRGDRARSVPRPLQTFTARTKLTLTERMKFHFFSFQICNHPRFV